MSTASNTGHRGLYMENGSGGMLGDLVFNGGQYGIVSDDMLSCSRLTIV
jgi:glucan 1,3-beta-glucosidase